MERRELYEPEDIEQLLIERPYNELLEEERAFVLRHLSGRDEYETLRALLLKVHDDEGRAAEPIDAAPTVRAHVMDVFRAEQQPQWRIWLNSTGAFLFPREASAMWRPALALGSVALIVFFVANSTWMMDRKESAQLAELKEVNKVENDGKPQPASPPATVADAEHQPQSETVNPTDVHSETTVSAEADQEPVRLDNVQASLAAEQVVEQPAPPPAAEELLDLAKKEHVAAVNFDVRTKAVGSAAPAKTTLDSGITFPGAASHTVTQNELAHNFSSADLAEVKTVEAVSVQSAKRFKESEKAKKREERRRAAGWSEGDRDESEATADAGAYIGLLRAAW